MHLTLVLLIERFLCKTGDEYTKNMLSLSLFFSIWLYQKCEWSCFICNLGDPSCPLRTGHFRIVNNCHVATIALFIYFLCFFFRWLATFYSLILFQWLLVFKIMFRFLFTQNIKRICVRPDLGYKTNWQHKEKCRGSIKIKRKLSVNMRILSHKSPRRSTTRPPPCPQLFLVLCYLICRCLLVSSFLIRVVLHLT